MAEAEPTKEHIDARIQELVAAIRSDKAEIAQREAHIDMLKDALRHLLQEKGESWDDDLGYARLVAEGERTYYDAAALDELIIEDPLRYGWLKDYRIKSTIQSRVQVK